jgi:replicative superfamily II helicase
METGTGKTLIAVMLVKHYADTHEHFRQRDTPAQKIVVCVVPTTILVAQQAAVFRRHVNVGVGEYTGASRVDSWNKDRWSQEAKYAELVVIMNILQDFV